MILLVINVQVREAILMLNFRNITVIPSFNFSTTNRRYNVNTNQI